MQNDPHSPRTPREPRGGGVFIALGAVGGAIGGGLLGQPSAGLVAGVIGGTAMHGLLWYLDSRKR